MEFATAPERARGVRYTAPINWAAVDMVIQTTEGSRLQRELFGRRFKKALRENGPEAMTPWFRFHYCAARVAMGDYSDYWGWEFRSTNEKGSEGWSAHLFWDETWLPKWGGGPVRRLLVLGEQGVGDAIFYASMLPECLVRAQEVIFETEPRLFSLLERSFPRLKCRPEREFEDRRTDYGTIDAFIPAGDLMRMFRRAKTHFPRVPYLKPDPARVAEMAGFTGKTAISWKGRQGSLDPLALGFESSEIVSVQYGESHADIPDPGIDLRNDIEGVVALLAVCSRLVTVPTSVHHMAGAVGRPTAVIHPALNGTEASSIKWDVMPGPSPFYGGLTVYRSIDEWRQACR